MTSTTNPAGSPTVRDLTKRTPAPDVKEKQDPKQTEGEFLRDLDKATRRKS